MEEKEAMQIVQRLIEDNIADLRVEFAEAKSVPLNRVAKIARAMDCERMLDDMEHIGYVLSCFYKYLERTRWK